jgi:nitrate reductase gamma subunit
MSFLTIAFAALFYAATILLIVGLVRRIMLYWKTPAPLKIPMRIAKLSESSDL